MSFVPLREPTARVVMRAPASRISLRRWRMLWRSARLRRATLAIVMLNDLPVDADVTGAEV